MIISIEGEEKSGKSTFAYSAPLPIVSFSFDMSHDRAINGTQHERLFKGLGINVVTVRGSEPVPPVDRGADITVYSAPAPMQMDPNKTTGMLAWWEKWNMAILQQIEQPGTLMLDTMTLLRNHRVDAHAESGGWRQLTQIMYGVPNTSIRDIYIYCKSYSKDLVALHHLRAKWGKVMVDGKIVDGPLDGQFEANGLSDTGKYVDVVLRMARAATTDKRRDAEGKEFSATMKGSIQLCGYNPGLEGLPLLDPDWNSVVDLITGAGWAGEPFARRV